jgi:Domain of unknown function (DUF4340)
MQSKGFLALLAVTVLVLIGAVAVIATGGSGRVREARAGEPVVPGLAGRIAEVATVKFSGVGYEATLKRTGEGEKQQWTLAEKGGYPVDGGKIRQTLLGFAELKLVEPKTRKPDLYKRLDVEDPGTDRGKETNHSKLVVLSDAKGERLAELIVGKRRADSLGTGIDGLYVRHPGDAQAWLAQGTVDLPSEPKEWLDKKVVSIPASRIRQVVLTHPDGTTLTLKRDKEDAKLAVADAPADAKFKNDGAVAEPAGVLDSLELNDVRPAAEMPAPAEGAAKAEWTTFDGLVITGTSFEKDGTSWVRLAASAGDDKAKKEADELNAKLAPWTFAVYQYKTNAMKTKLADLVEAPKGS